MNSHICQQMLDLLVMYGDVRLRRIHESPTGWIVDFSLTDAHALARIVVSAGNSNVRCEVLSCGQYGTPNRYDPAQLYYRISSSCPVRLEHRLSAIDVFVISLAHDLQQFGQLPDEEANRIIGRINGRLENNTMNSSDHSPSS